ncbi:MAG: hypothetical protein LBT23_10115 [Synergistaceae bacterium]|jgi:hypothetical protein|nr:hypothetical protein [Synergistaceae bacterium]
MKAKRKSQLIIWLTLSILLGALARLLEALADLLRLLGRFTRKLYHPVRYFQRQLTATLICGKKNSAPLL